MISMSGETAVMWLKRFEEEDFYVDNKYMAAIIMCHRYLYTFHADEIFCEMMARVEGL